MQPAADLPLAYDWYNVDISVGVVVAVVNESMEPALIEVMWNDGTVHKVYADDVETIQKRVKKTN